LGIRDSLRKVELQRSNARLLDLSERDGLTGLANRRAVDRMLEESWADCAAHNHPMAVIMVDVDYFKKFNDEYGHPAGDDCLRQVAGALHQHVRLTGDLAGRFGGEEFILILPGADAQGASQVAARACAAVEALHIPHAAAPTARFVTASLGLACAQPARGGAVSDLVRAADAALYEAKQTGRARVVCTEVAF
jgi:diguanylate cyclase (GGDEF)-like protein